MSRVANLRVDLQKQDKTESNNICTLIRALLGINRVFKRRCVCGSGERLLAEAFACGFIQCHFVETIPLKEKASL